MNMLIEYDYAESYNYEGTHPEPERQHWNDAGADLKSIANHILKPQEIWLAPTGIKVKVPNGYVGLIFSRSGFAKYGITLANSVGVIDAGYRGEIKIVIHNLSQNPYTFEQGTKVAQMLIQPVEQKQLMEVDSLEDTQRGEGGFGSTGIR